MSVISEAYEALKDYPVNEAFDSKKGHSTFAQAYASRQSQRAAAKKRMEFASTQSEADDARRRVNHLSKKISKYNKYDDKHGILSDNERTYSGSRFEIKRINPGAYY